jgi:LysW-gamma-L-lysine carboxypeptidase
VIAGVSREKRAETRAGYARSDAHAVDVLFDLVATPSVSGGERDAVERFVMHARALGMEAEIDEAGSGVAARGEGTQRVEPRRAAEEGGEEGNGQWASPHLGNGGGEQRSRAVDPVVEIVLLGHIDTVAGEIPVRIEGEGAERVLHGRGSVDAKGPLCAMLVAAARATLPEGVTVRVCGAVGEETPHSRGARHIARAFKPDACIIGEPSGWEGVTLGYKGRLVVRIEVERACHHSAGPGESAPDVVCALWNGVLGSVREMNERRSHEVTKSQSHEVTKTQSHEVTESQSQGEGKRPGAFEVIQCSLRSMASGSDGLMDRAAVVGGFRLPRWVGPEALQARIEAIAAGIEGVTLRFEGHERAHAVDRNDPVARALSVGVRAEGGTPRPKLKTGTADLNVVAPVWRCPIAAYGPGDSALDHTPIEHLPIAEYLRSIRVLTRAIETLAAELMATRWPASGGIGA